MTDRPNEPAYPLSITGDGTFKEMLPYDGMTIREKIAAQAMQGMCANMGKMSILDMQEAPENIAGWAVRFADALLKELSKPTKTS
jgi:hypothetical protein